MKILIILSVLMLGGCNENTLFDKKSYVNMPLKINAPLDVNSEAFVANLLGQIEKHYGYASVNIGQFTPPVYIVTEDTPTVRVKVTQGFAPLQELWEEVPLPVDFIPSAGTDKEAVIYNPSTGEMWEFWLMNKTGVQIVNSSSQTVDEWGARWGGYIDDISKNPGYFETVNGDWDTVTGIKYGATATGIPFLAGLMTIEEQESGEINHVIGLAIPEVLAYPRWSWPATRSDGQDTSPDAIPEGTIFRLPADLDLDAMTMDPYARMIARAVQRYGMVVWDRAGNVSFRGENAHNPARYPDGNPYTKEGGILNCPDGVFQFSCWPTGQGRLRGFPWDKLQALETRMNQ